jgi:small GTP-binding protein
VGFPSVGKSTLLSQLTDTESEAASYEFTTLTCIPGTFFHKGCRIQLLDLPGIIEGAAEGRGKGKQVVAVAKTCDLILIVLDASKPMTHKTIIENELENFGIRLNKEPPNITMTKKVKGPISISSTVPLTHLNLQRVQAICRELRVSSTDFVFRCDATEDELIDVIDGSRVYVPCLYLLNMVDKITIEELDVLDQLPDVIPISARERWNFDDLVDIIWQKLKMIRVYTKPKGQIPDLEQPMVLPADKRTVHDLCLRIHKSLAENFKYAWVWGRSVKFNPQRVGANHVLQDEDVVQIVKNV